MINRVHYKDVCDLTCTDNGQTRPAEVLNFNAKNFLSVSLNRTVRLEMRYDAKHDQYVGNMANMEFTTKGPQVI